VDARQFVEDYLPSRFAELGGNQPPITSRASGVFRVVGSGEWSLRLEAGRLEIEKGMRDDCALQLSLHADDLEPLVKRLLDAASESLGSLAASSLTALNWDEETVGLVKNIPGSALVLVHDDGADRQLLITPGHGLADFAAAACRIECRMSDLLEAQAKRESAMQLFMDGKILLHGDAQIALALGGVLAG